VLTTEATANQVHPVLEATDLRVAYGDLEVVRGASLKVVPGEVVALLGPNGAGKTTLLLALAGFLKAAGGQVSMFGAPAVGPAHRRARQGVAFIGDDRNLFRSLTVRQSMRMIRKDPAGLTEMFPELQVKMKAKGSLLSGGQQQMLALGRAMIADPKILIIDELSLGLAPIVRDRLLLNLRSIADAGGSVLVVEQSARSVLEVADRAYVMGRGEILADGRGSDWLANFEELSDLFLR
jgi:branched-chain amino acid transport system ATP-binding protein